MIKEFDYNSPYFVGKVKNHNKYKQDLIAKINKASCDSLIQNDDYYKDNINRVDWNDCHNMERDWVVESKPYLSDYLSEWATSIHFDEWTINQIWFQQYYNNGSHGWHTHGSNFTGVYYVDLPKETPKTQLALHNGKIVNVDVEEGDVLIFPSYVIHKAPRNKSNKTKTIISFNLDVIKPNIDYLNNILEKNIAEAE